MPTGPERVDDRPLLGRLVTYGLLAALATTALTGSEPWPLSSFQLFVSERTGEQVVHELVVELPDGTVVAFGERDLLAVEPDLADAVDSLLARDVAVREATVVEWVSQLGVSGWTAIRLDRITSRHELDARHPPTVGRQVVVELER